jgi:hypothetical protein
MTMRTVLLAAAAALTAATPAIAQDAASKPPTEQEMEVASETLSLLVSGLNSKEVPQETKNGLFGCLYENSLGEISAAATKAFAENKDLDANDPTLRLIVLAKVCGAPVPQPAEGAPAKSEPESR